MFESAELGHEVSKAKYDREVPKLREALLEAQYDLLEQKRFATLILIGGVDGAGKGETVNVLNEWLDPRHVHTHALGQPTDEELSHPPYWRFWRSLPPRGKIGIFFGSWYTQPIISRVFRRSSGPELDQAVDRIVHFERMLADEGIALVKLWFHLSKSQQEKRLNALSKDKRTRWRVTERDWEHFALYDRFRKTSERVLRHTSTGHAPWHVVEGLDARYRSLTAGRIVLDAMSERLAAGAATSGKTAAKGPEKAPAKGPDEAAAKGAAAKVAAAKGAKKDAKPAAAEALDPTNLFHALDLKSHVTKETYEKKLEALQGRLNMLTRHKKFSKVGVVAVFEGVDAAGKGGAIRRVTQALDARAYRVHPVAAPTEEERVQPYLWRFWRHVPAHGSIAIFDRSWYGRVLVERVEGFCRESDWQRAYGEINAFEEALVEHGIVVTKIWMHVDPKEQLRRFEERQATGFKRFKITEEDWRNREKWPHYETAACAMFDRTSTEIAPWTLVAANDKRGARLKVLDTLCDRLERALERA
jgi:polyphosphate kinase 2 (PPK2 family)